MLEGIRYTDPLLWIFFHKLLYEVLGLIGHNFEHLTFLEIDLLIEDGLPILLLVAVVERLGET